MTVTASASVVTLTGQPVSRSSDRVQDDDRAGLASSLEERAADSAALEAALAAADVEELERSAQQFQALESFFMRQKLRAIVQRERKGQLRERDGVRDVAEWACLKYGSSLAEARRWTRVAHRFEELPQIALAFEHGELSWESASALVELATPDDEEELLTWSKELTPEGIRRVPPTRRSIGTHVTATRAAGSPAVVAPGSSRVTT